MNEEDIADTQVWDYIISVFGENTVWSRLLMKELLLCDEEGVHMNWDEADDLNFLFTWDDTPQGREFWQPLHEFCERWRRNHDEPIPQM